MTEQIQCLPGNGLGGGLMDYRGTHEETCGADGNVHYLDCVDDFMDVYRCQNS